MPMTWDSTERWLAVDVSFPGLESVPGILSSGKLSVVFSKLFSSLLCSFLKLLLSAFGSPELILQFSYFVYSVSDTGLDCG